MFRGRGLNLLISNFGGPCNPARAVGKLYDYFVQMRTKREQRLILQKANKAVGKLIA